MPKHGDWVFQCQRKTERPHQVNDILCSSTGRPIVRSPFTIRSRMEVSGRTSTCQRPRALGVKRVTPSPTEIRRSRCHMVAAGGVRWIPGSDSWRQQNIGDRQAGEEAVRLGESGNEPGNCGGESGYGCEDGAEVPPIGRVPSELTLADTRRSFPSGVGRGA
jgi:hypothetical protein